jgi:retron-type reverse transcriptase
MPKRHKHLIEHIASIDNLREAYKRTAKGKRLSWGYLEFKEYAESNLILMREQILDGSWVQGPYREFTIFEPKPREISALYFRDRVAQHALVNIIGPIFESTLLPYTFACREGMGTHKGVKHIQSNLRRHQFKYFLKTDYRKFFPSIDHSILYELIQRKIKCKRTLELMRAMISVSGKGLPIGSLTSQLFANVYAGVIDRFIHFDLGARHWARYMDDIIILSNNPFELRGWFNQIEAESIEKLSLTISKWQVSPVNKGINFLGYRIWPKHKLLRKQSVVDAKRKISRFIEFGEIDSLSKFIASWKGHASFADTCHLFNYIEDRYGIACH